MSVCAIGLVGLAVPLLSPARGQSAQFTRFPSTRPLVLRISFESRNELRDVGRLDIWEVHYEAEGDRGYVVAQVSPAEQAWLAEEGYAVSVDSRSFHPATIPDYPCYRTIAELYDDLQIVHADHADIVELIDIGDSFEGRDIWVARITNQATPAPKPIFFLMANIHGRELITNEAAMVFIDHLTDNYGFDPDITWLVDHHEIHVAVSVNPDGHVKNEPGRPWMNWRKNANSNFCTGSQYYEGVDLNRNSSFAWSFCPPGGCSSAGECSEVFRGPSAASESETQAVENYVRTLFPDQRDEPLDAAAPLTTTGVFITLHAPGNLVMWPWGMLYDPAPNATELQALGEKMATYNGYDPIQLSDLYPIDGATDNWAYGELGVAAYTFEIGNDFYPPCSFYDTFIQPNILAFTYAAKVARTPYLTARGPDVVYAPVDSTQASSTVSHTVAVTITDASTGGDVLTAAELYVNTPPWLGGTPIAMSAEDGAFDEVSESVVAILDTSALSLGRHILFVRGQDASGYWGPFTAAWLDVGYLTYFPLAARGYP